MVEKLVEWIESEECINACGLERMAVGMSTDSLLEPEFSAKLCSSECRNNCPNIVDLYVNLAAGEGQSLRSSLSWSRQFIWTIYIIDLRQQFIWTIYILIK